VLGSRPVDESVRLEVAGLDPGAEAHGVGDHVPVGRCLDTGRQIDGDAAREKRAAAAAARPEVAARDDEPTCL